MPKVELEMTMNQEEFKEFQDATNGAHFFKLTVLNSLHNQATIIHYITSTESEYNAAPDD